MEKEVSPPCRWMDRETEICVNADCPLCADYCPVADVPFVCKHEDRSELPTQR